jgi:hypothetical protein
VVDSAAAAMDVDAQHGEATAAAVASSAAYLSSEELLLVLLAASCDPYEAVARWASRQTAFVTDRQQRATTALCGTCEAASV